MSDSNNWQFTDRLTNEEFILLLPYLSLENQYLTQVKRTKWKRLIDANFQTFVFMCGACNKTVKFEFVNQHFKSKQHHKNLRSNVVQLYHPFYTYGKGDTVLARGDKISSEQRKAALKEANMQIRSFTREAATAKHFVEIVRRREKKCIDEFLTNLSLDLKAEKPDQMFVNVTLPFDDLPDLMFCANEDAGWKAAIAWKDFNRKSAFTCNICTVRCSGIDSLNSHLKGYSHKCKQLLIMALLYEKSSKVTKYCTIHVGDELMISIHDSARSYYREDVEEWQNRNSEDGDNSSDGGYSIPDLPNHVSSKAKGLEELTQKVIKKFEVEDRKSDPKNYWGHIGVEYVLKVLKHGEDHSPTYECGLCEIVGNEERMQRHLLCFDHMKKYLDLHYADTMRKYENTMGHMRYADFRAVMGEVATRVAIEIEKHHGRSLPFPVPVTEYRQQRANLISQVYGLLHATQDHGPSFSNVVTAHEIEKLKANCSEINRIVWDASKGLVFTMTPTDKVYLHQQTHDPIIRLREYNAKMGKKQERGQTPTAPESRRVRSKSPRRERRTVRSRSRSPRRSGGGGGGGGGHNIWDVYRRELANAATQIEHTYEGYRRNPESHPLYEKEWNEFWQNRKMELEREGINHRTYNFQPEWVHFFKQRIEQLFGDALQKAKVAIRCKLNIPLDAEEDCNKHSDDSSLRYDREMNLSRPIEPLLNSGRLSNRQEEEIIRNRDGSRKRPGYDDYDNAPINKRYFEEPVDYSGDRYEDDRSMERNPPGWGPITTSSTTTPMIDKIPKITDNHSNIVHVLRLMTALEEHLGSLGSKVMDMLSTALQLEKTFQGDVIAFESKILTSNNCNLLETAMEKLKGILFAGLLDDKKVIAFNRVIQFTTELLKYAEKMGWRQNVFMPEEHQSELSNNGRQSLGEVREKSLTDTLMDLMSDQSNDRSEGTAICPPPPVIRMTHKSDMLNPGASLANFNTQLVSRPPQTQQTQQQQFRESSRMMSRGGPTGPSGSGSGNSLNNNNFSNNTNNARFSNMDAPQGSLGPSGASRSIMYSSAGNQSGPNLSVNNKSVRPIGQSVGASYRGPLGSRSNQGNLTWNAWSKN